MDVERYLGPRPQPQQPMGMQDPGQGIPMGAGLGPVMPQGQGEMLNE